jgi:hypothetical protein
VLDRLDRELIVSDLVFLALIGAFLLGLVALLKGVSRL